MWVTLCDVMTGQIVDVPSQNSSMYWWEDGSGSCDCNRASYISEELDDFLEKEQRKAFPELKEWQSYCYGCERVLVVDVHGDFEGSTHDEVLARVNIDYPEALRVKAQERYFLMCKGQQ